ncbi:glutathione-dependent formaldehyde dehydrogenase [Tessaracoccus sp. MC1865]|uniref:zinc-dependent alcohol dehydrogenase n=1 Tax=Tessaracoccus sp. MC1865 TaxID=2760310 RepID=UPI0015FEFB76|nr:zinc-dependent alcohol dehydrogenase [Tessaracoccus sp. MC1865]MBB1483242.1 glutathione-dependent formaldehyde dehydrogenase [Tessaracoccus sp. MC1865]QTO37345.1 glutathione-dependent formaldehyde dehydrogenase [Tessaracoccus sp. MC1865]
MFAVTWQGIEDIRTVEVDEPRIMEPTDAVLRVTSTAICGSDLHLYSTFAPFLEKGDILGHEFMGIVEEVGGAVQNLAVGDRVVVPFTITCGHCWMCTRGLHTQCETTQVREQGRGAALFGYTSMYGGVPGGQAERVRVPHADFGPVKLPADFDDERFLYLSDILPTAWQAAKYAEVKPGDTVAVLGLGPVGQMAVRSAFRQGATRVLGVDLVDERLRLAEEWGAETVDYRQVKDVAVALRGRTDGRGPDCVIDAVGMEAHGNPVTAQIIAGTARMPKPVGRRMFKDLGIDRLDALHTAIDAVRRGGVLSVAGVYGGMVDPMPMMTLFDKQLTLRLGQCNVPRWTDELLALALEDGDVMGLEGFATHRVPLSEASEAYKMFQTKSDGCLKVVLQP